MSVLWGGWTVLLSLALLGLIELQHQWWLEVELQSNLDRLAAQTTARLDTLADQTHRLVQLMQAARATQLSLMATPAGPPAAAAARSTLVALSALCVAARTLWIAQKPLWIIPAQARKEIHWGTKFPEFPYRFNGADSLGPKPWKRTASTLEVRRQSLSRSSSATLYFGGKREGWRARWGNNKKNSNQVKSLWRLPFGL